MDNKIVLMVIVAIVLGMLVANMFKEVCGCKVVEGQCTVLDSTCRYGRKSPALCGIQSEVIIGAGSMIRIRQLLITAVNHVLQTDRIPNQNLRFIKTYG